MDYSTSILITSLNRNIQLYTNHPAYQARRSRSIFGLGLGTERLKKRKLRGREGPICRDTYGLWLGLTRQISLFLRSFLLQASTCLPLFFSPQPHHAVSEANLTLIRPHLLYVTARAPRLLRNGGRRGKKKPFVSQQNMHRSNSHTVPSITQGQKYNEIFP